MNEIMPLVYVILLNYKNYQDTIECIKSLSSNFYLNFKIIVLDNNSKNGSEEHIQEFIEKYAMKNINFIQTGANLGFAGGVNVGIRYALNDVNMKYVWILNNDTEVDRFALYELVNKMQNDKSIGICGSKLVDFYDHKTLQGYGGKYHNKLGYATIVMNINDIPSMNYTIGASMLVSKEFLNKVGLMCEDYFLYYEEFDWAMRGKTQGYRIDCAIDSIVYHKEGASIGSSASISRKSLLSDYYIQKNKLRITKKFYPQNIMTVRIAMCIGVIRRLLHGEFAKALQQFKIIFQG